MNCVICNDYIYLIPCCLFCIRILLYAHDFPVLCVAHELALLCTVSSWRSSNGLGAFTLVDRPILLVLCHLVLSLHQYYISLYLSSRRADICPPLRRYCILHETLEPSFAILALYPSPRRRNSKRNTACPIMESGRWQFRVKK